MEVLAAAEDEFDADCAVVAADAAVFAFLPPAAAAARIMAKASLTGAVPGPCCVGAIVSDCLDLKMIQLCLNLTRGSCHDGA